MLAGTRGRRRRRGAALVEAAVVLPVFFLLVLSGLLLGVKLFHQQERGHLTRELTRWASLQDLDALTPDQIRQMIPPSNTAGFDPNDVEVSWTKSSDGRKITVTIKSPKPTGSTPPRHIVTKTVWNPY